MKITKKELDRDITLRNHNQEKDYLVVDNKISRDEEEESRMLNQKYPN